MQITSRLKKHFFRDAFPPSNNFDGPVGIPPVGGFRPHESDDQQPATTSTTVEVVVTSFTVPAIYGDEGGCLSQIREVCIDLCSTKHKIL